MTLCPYSAEEPELGNLTVSEVSWDGFQPTWTAADGAFETFVLQVQESDNPEEVQNHTVPGGLRFVNITALKDYTRYNITLYGVIQGYRTKPLSAETMTGTLSKSFIHFHVPFFFEDRDVRAYTRGQFCMGACN